MQYSIPNSTRDAGFWIGARDDQCDDLGVTTEETNHDVHILGFFFFVDLEGEPPQFCLLFYSHCFRISLFSPDRRPWL